MRKNKTIIITTFVLLFIIIMMQNTHLVVLKLFFWEFEIQMFYIPVFFVISPVAGYFIAKLIGSRKNVE